MIISWFFLGLISLSIALYLVQLLALRKKLNEKFETEFTPPISIIKPLKGLDDNLFDNIESFCKQDYPQYEVILSLEDYNDPAYRIVRKIKDKYPDKVTIIIDNSDNSLNPKVRNMIGAYKASKYEYFLISDSNVSVDSDYLKRTVKMISSSEVGLVTNMIAGVGERSIGALFENLHLNSFILLSTCFLDTFLKIPCSIGKSMLMRKKDFEAIGGFSSIRDILAEDYFIGSLMHRMGKRVLLSNYIVKNFNEYWSMKRFLNRHTRWAKIRWKISGAKYFTEPLCNPVYLSFAHIIVSGFSQNAMVIFLGISFIKILGDLLVGKGLQLKPSLKYVLIPIKDEITGFLWIIPFFTNKVSWRNNKYIIGKYTKLRPSESAGFSLRVQFMRLKTIIN